MIGGNLKKLAEQHGMKIASGVAYGTMMGYAVTLNEGSGYKCMVVSTTFPDPVQKSQLESHLNQQNLTKEYRVQTLTFGETFIRIVFTDTVGTMKKVEAFIDFFFPLLGQYGATGAEICTACGQPLAGSGEWKLIEGTAHCLHGACAQNLRQAIADADTKRKADNNGSYFWGVVGALLGAAVGAILWAVILELGFYAAIVGLVIGLLANWGYNLLHGKQGRGKVVILILAVIFGVVLGSFLADAYEAITLIKDETWAGLAYSDIPATLLYLLQTEAEYRTNVITRILMGLVFAGLGVFSLLRQTGKEVSGVKMINLP